MHFHLIHSKEPLYRNKELLQLVGPRIIHGRSCANTDTFETRTSFPPYGYSRKVQLFVVKCLFSSAEGARRALLACSPRHDRPRTTYLDPASLQEANDQRLSIMQLRSKPPIQHPVLTRYSHCVMHRKCACINQHSRNCSQSLRCPMYKNRIPYILHSFFCTNLFRS